MKEGADEDYDADDGDDDEDDDDDDVFRAPSVTRPLSLHLTF